MSYRGLLHKNGNNPKNEVELKNGDDLYKEDDPKIKVNLKNEEDPLEKRSEKLRRPKE